MVEHLARLGYNVISRHAVLHFLGCELRPGDIVKLKYLSLEDHDPLKPSWGKTGIVIRTFVGGHHYDRHMQAEFLDPFGNVVCLDVANLEVVAPDET